MDGDLNTTTQQSGSENQFTQSQGGDTGGSNGLRVFERASQQAGQQAGQQTGEQQARTAQQTQQPRQPSTEGLADSQRQQIQQLQQQGADPKVIAQAIVEAQREAQRQDEAAKQNELTPEQFRERFNVFEMNKDTMDSIFGFDATEEQVNAFNEVIKRTTAMAVRFADYYAKQQIDALRQEIGPIQNTYKKLQAQSYDQQLFKTYPQLAKHKSVVNMAIQSLRAEGKKFSNAGEAAKAVYQRAATVLKDAGFDINQQSTQTASTQTRQTTPTQSRRPASLSMGGGRGAKPSASSQVQSKGLAVFGK